MTKLQELARKIAIKLFDEGVLDGTAAEIHAAEYAESEISAALEPLLKAFQLAGRYAHHLDSCARWHSQTAEYCDCGYGKMAKVCEEQLTQWRMR